MQREIFISYSQPDRELALRLVARLESSGLRCWIAPRDISPAADWAAEIIEGISQARVLLLIFSASANASPQVRREVERAIDHGLLVLPFRIDDVKPSKGLEYFLSSQHWMDAFPAPLEPHFERLCEHLRKLLLAPPESSAASAAASSTGASLDETELRFIEAQLAGYLGPVAKYLVKRLKARTSAMDELISGLGAEIESVEHRRQFIDTCRQHWRAR